MFLENEFGPTKTPSQPTQISTHINHTLIRGDMMEKREGHSSASQIYHYHLTVDSRKDLGG